MAHTCPNCGSMCYCNGDIDDICLDMADDIMACTCCDEEDDDDWGYEEEDFQHTEFDEPKKS